MLFRSSTIIYPLQDSHPLSDKNIQFILECGNTSSSFLNALNECMEKKLELRMDIFRKFLSDNAINCYQKAVNLDSTKTENRIRLAGAYMESGGPPMQGVSILLDIVRKDSTNVDALLMLGRFGIISGQFDKAIAQRCRDTYLKF